MTTWQRFMKWCSLADRYPHIPHVTREGNLAVIRRQK